jgi:hypothetical protein
MADLKSALGAMEHDLLGLELDDVLEGCVQPIEDVADRLEHVAVPVLANREPRAGTLFVKRLESSPDGRLRPRRRFIGQGKRGRPVASIPDEHDVAEARRCIDAAWNELQQYRQAVAQRVPSVRRDELRARAIAEIRRAARWLDDIANRNDPNWKDEDQT